MMNILENLLTPKELSLLSGNFIDNNELFDRLIKEKVILAVDWSGEENEFEIGHFLQDRLQQLEIVTPFDFKAAYTELDQKIVTGNMERGDAVFFILKSYQKRLKKEGLDICLVDRKNDTYYLILLKDAQVKKIKKLKDHFWKILPFGAASGEVLYTINCSCGSMNVWQLKRSEAAPTDDYCQDCGKMLFDKDGNALMAVEKDYI